MDSDTTFVCKNCGKSFTKSKKYISKNNGKTPIYCSQKCYKEYNRSKTITVNCENCGKELTILQSDYNKSTSKHFFSVIVLVQQYTIIPTG